MLDAHGREEVLGAVRLLGEQGLTLMAVTQEMDELPAASRVVALEAGRVAFLGSPAELFDDAGLLGRLSLGVPVAAEVALRLRSAGTPMSRLPLTIEDLVTCLTKAGVPSASQRRLNGARGETAGGAAVAWRAPRRGAKADGRRRGLALRCERLSFGYGGGATTVPALSEVSFSIAAGSSTALLGPSGAGKSTLLLLLRGLLGPDEGLVEIDGENAESPEHRALQRRVGIVFQRPEVQLFATTVAEDVAFGPRQLGWAEEDVGSAVEESLEAVGLPRSGYGERHPYSLSGGEQRRAALAGVLAMRPGALLLDEPFMSLDPGGRRDLAAVLRRLKQDGTTLVLVTHDVDQAWELCDERLILTAGRLLSHGPWVFDEAGAAVMRTAGLPLPALVDLWRRLDLPADRAPRTAAAAADMLAGVIAAGAGSTRLPRGEGKP
jgi:energy-coupling factor transport system ATP-binding protein